MELRHIKHFVALAQSKSYSVAASKLDISQPSLTRSIQKMEQSLGVKLFTRDSRRVALTYHGDLVLKHSDKILNTVCNLEADIKINSGRSSGKLTIGGGTLASSNILNDILHNFSKEHPNVSVELRTRDIDELCSLLSKGDIDLFISEIKVSGLSEREELQVISYKKSRGVFFCRPGHPLLNDKYLYTPRLKDFPISLPRATTSDIESLFGDLFDANRSAFSGLFKFEYFHSVSKTIAESDMIGLIPEIVIANELASGELVLLDVLDMPDIQVDYGVVYHKSRAPDGARKLFLEFFKTLVDKPCH